MADARDLARELLERARDDERAARALLSAGELSDAIVGFHAQQAVEKALKTALAGVGWNPRRPGWIAGTSPGSPNLSLPVATTAGT